MVASSLPDRQLAQTHIILYSTTYLFINNYFSILYVYTFIYLHKNLLLYTIVIIFDLQLCIKQ